MTLNIKRGWENGRNSGESSTCGGKEMKLTKMTIPQARNYQCNKCKRILPHKDMYDDNICAICYMDESETAGREI